MFSSNARLNSRINHFEERVLAGHYGHRYDPARPTIHAGILGSLWAGLSVFRDRCFAPSAVNQSVTRDRTLKTGELETLTHLSNTLLEKSRICDNGLKKETWRSSRRTVIVARKQSRRAQLLYDYFSLHPRVGSAIVIVCSTRGKRVGEGSAASNAVGIDAIETRRVHRWTLRDGMV